MKVDLYTKIVLTAIAIALFLNVMKTVSPMTGLAEEQRSRRSIKRIIERGCTAEGRVPEGGGYVSLDISC